MQAAERDVEDAGAVEQPRPATTGRDASTFLSGGPVRGPSLSNAGYNDALFESSPFLRSMKAAVSGYVMPPAQNAQAPQLTKVLALEDPRLKPTIERPGREAWQQVMTKLVVSAGAVQAKPTAYYLAGAMGVGKIALSARLLAQGAIPEQVVRADADALHTMIPEANELLALGEQRAMDVVHEETSLIARSAYAQALAEKRDVVNNSMFGTEHQLSRLKAAKTAGFKRVTVALVSTLDVAKQRASASGNWFDDKLMVEGHRLFARNFEALVKESDELVLVRNTGPALEIIGHARAGQLTVTNQASYDAFRAMGN